MTDARQELLLAALLLWPLAAAAVVGLRWARSGAGSAIFSVVAAAVTLVAAAALMPADGTLSTAIPGLLGAIELQADPVARAFVLVAAFVWFVTSLYAVGYLRDDPAAGRFRAISLVLLSANLGVFVAGDWLSLLVCFELLGLVGLLFVVHDGGENARRAATKYFWMTLTGGVALLAGIVLWNLAAGATAGGSPAGSVIPPLPDTELAHWAAVLVLAGFGVKAGMIGLHVWLPDAHTAAPAPASAVLSGVMIKAGAYGVYRCLGALSDPRSAPSLALDFGYAVLVLGLAGMLVGAIAALGQRHAKRLLAWSSISQMGFILAALASAAVIGSNGSGGSVAGLFHALNHALFKSVLFLAVGAIVHAAGTGDMDRLGGRLRASPLLAAGLLAAVAGIVGLPGFNGFESKAMIHHALAELAAHDPRLVVAEWIFYAASVGTAAMFLRLLHALLGPAPAGLRPSALSVSIQVGVALPGVLMLAIGLRPGWVLARLQGSVTTPAGDAVYALHGSPVEYALPFALLALGAVAVVLARSAGLFGRRLPAWASMDAAYRGFALGVDRLCHRFADFSGRLRNGSQALLRRGYLRMRRGLAWNWTDWSAVAALGAEMRTPRDRAYRLLDQQRDLLVSRALELACRRCEKDPEAGPAHRERILDATRHYAGWLATRLLNAGMGLGAEAGRSLAAGGDGVERLARCAVEMAAIDVESGHETRAAHLADEALDSLIGPHSEAPVQPMPFRHWLPEMGSVLFNLLTDPGRSHWPVTENLAGGALASRLRAALHRLARDPGAGLAVAILLLALIFGLSARG